MTGPTPTTRTARTAVLVSALALAVATATTLLALGLALTDDPAAVAPTRAKAAATDADARAFVAAIDDVVRSGDGSALKEVVAADFVDHAPSAASTGGRDDLLRDLMTLRASFTHLELAVDDVVVGGDLAMVRLTFRGTRRGEFLGIRLEPAPATWRELAILRISAGRVAERWAAGDAGALFASLGVAVLAWPPALPTVALARFVYAPGGGGVDPALPGPGLLVVEAGALTVRGNGTVGIVRAAGDGGADDPDPVAAGTVATASAGDAIVVPAGSPGVSNDGAVPAVALGLALFTPPASDPSLNAIAAHGDGPTAAREQALGLRMIGATGHRALPPGLTVHPIAAATATALPAGPVLVGIGRVVLPPGTNLPAHWVPGLELFAVEEGSLQIDSAGGLAAARPTGPQILTTAPRSPVTVEAGGVAVVQAASVAAVGGTGDGALGLLVVFVAAVPTTTSPL